MNDQEDHDLGQLLSELEALRRANSYLRMKIRYLEGGRDKCKVSKWTKVKGALGLEKEKDDCLTLKVPNSSSDPSSSISVSPAGSYLSHSSSLQYRSRLHSSSSSEEDIREGTSIKRRSSINEKVYGKKDEGRRSKSLDGETSKTLEEHINKKLDGKEMGQKSYKTPWSKVKGIIRKKSQEEKHKMFFQNEHTSGDEDIDVSKLNTPKLTLTLPSNEELCSETNPRKRRHDSTSKETNAVSPQLSRKSKWFKVRSVFLQGSRSAPASPIRLDSFLYELESDDVSSGEILEEKEEEVFHDNGNIRYEIERGYAQLQSRLTDEFSKKIESMVERKRSERRDQNRERDLSPEFKKKLEEWDRIKQGKEPLKKFEKEKPKAKSNERMKKKVGKQEVLIPTSTGMFRFEGISDKFTRRLYEWEQARGITPEESTFLLLDPEYRPSYPESPDNPGVLVRSKSIGSIEGPSNLIFAQQPSSLSLNDMDELQACNENLMEIDVVSDNAMVPDLYGYAPEEVTRLIDSSSGESDKDMSHQQVVHSSYQLLQGNMTLLEKLKKEREACRQLEDDMRLLEGQIYNVSKSFEQDEAKRSVENLELYDYESEVLGDRLLENEDNQILEPINDFTVKFDDFKRVETTLAEEELAQNVYMFDQNYYPYEQNMSVDDIFRDLIEMADKLESAVVERDKEMLHIKSVLFRKQMESIENFSSFTLPIQCMRGRRSQELSRLPRQIMDKILELKQAIKTSGSTTEMIIDQPFIAPRTLQRTVAQEDLSPDFRPSSQTSSSASSFSYMPAGSNQDFSFSTQYGLNKFSAKDADSAEDFDDDDEHVFPSNVFVPTTRKIFSPVNEKEAVSEIIEEEEEGEVSEEECIENEENNNKPNPILRRPFFNMKSQSSSPLFERKPQKYSSFMILPEIENGSVLSPPPQVEAMKLGEELSSSLRERAMKIQKAREDFLNGRNNSVTIVVDNIDSPSSLLVKSASAGFISKEQNEDPNKSSISTNLDIKEEGAVSTLAKQAVETTLDPSDTRSCPSSPVLNKKAETTSWIKNPAKIFFRPKGKYMINNK